MSQGSLRQMAVPAIQWKRVIHFVEKPVVVGILAGSVSYFLNASGGDDIRMLGMSFGQNTAIGIASGVGVAVAEVSAPFVRRLPMPKWAKKYMQSVDEPLLAAAFTILGLKAFSNASSSSNTAMLELAGIAAGSAVAGAWFDDSFVKPALKSYFDRPAA